MNSLKKAIKHRVTQVGLIIAMGIFSAQPSFADDSATLTQILANTQFIMEEISLLPVAMVIQMKDIINMATQMTTTTDSNNYVTGSQASFSTVFNDYSNTISQQQSLSQQLTQQFLTGNGTYGMPKNANELSYGIMLGSVINPPSGGTRPDVNALGQSYLKHVAGTYFNLPQPSSGWVASTAATQYTELYNVTAAIASYNAYLLAGLYQQKDQDTNRINLMKQAVDATWFGNIQSEDIGLVFRQMLMYTSQVYVDLDRLLKIQQQQLAATAMTNTLLLIYASTSAATSLYSQAANAK